MIRAAILLPLALAAATARSTPPPAGFCAKFNCPARLLLPEDQLQQAWASPATTDEQRVEMERRIVAAGGASGSSGTANWTAIASSYFAWRSATFKAPPVLDRPLPLSTTRIETQEDRWEAMRAIAEAVIKSRLIDPSSAEFSWPYGFAAGFWKPFLNAKQLGDVTCGEVNSKNRLGGYVGARPFVVVMDGQSVKWAEVSDGGNFDITAAGCQRLAGQLPRWSHTALASQAAPIEKPSIAEELTKLSELRSKGLLTEQEFQAAKAKALAAQ